MASDFVLNMCVLSLDGLIRSNDVIIIMNDLSTLSLNELQVL